MSNAASSTDSSVSATMQFDHPRGPIYAWFTSAGLSRLELPHAEHGAQRRSVLHSGANDARVRTLNAALERYFSGIREDFNAIPIDFSGATPFQREVWDAARSVPWGTSATYGELAERLHKSKAAARAVGHALGQNPIAIIVPCHRFVGANGALHGFAAGLDWKRELLQLEGVLLG